VRDADHITFESDACSDLKTNITLTAGGQRMTEVKRSETAQRERVLLVRRFVLYIRNFE